MTHFANLDDDASDADVSDAINADLLEAVYDDNEHAARRAMENGWGAWLGSSWANNPNPKTNPVLLAFTTPGSQRVLNALQNWAHDLHTWKYDRWQPIHWAIAGRNEDAVAWALRQGVNVLECEESSSGAASGMRRSGLAIAAQMGDPAWLRRVIEMATAEGSDDDAPRSVWKKPMTTDELARRDGWQNLPSMTVVLHEMAEQDRRVALNLPEDEDGEPAVSGDWDGCLAVLKEHGFQVEGKKVKAARVTCALARRTPDAPHLEAYQRATLIAASLGSGWSSDHHPEETRHAPVKLFDVAGEALDTEWREALLLIGLREGPEHGSWARGASREFRRLLNLDDQASSWGAEERARLAQAFEDSLATVDVPLNERPMRGYETAFVDWRRPNRDGSSIWHERLILADEAMSVETSVAQESGARPRARL